MDQFVVAKKSKGHGDGEGTAKGRSLQRKCSNGDNPVELSTGYPQANDSFFVSKKSKGRGDQTLKGRPFNFGCFWGVGMEKVIHRLDGLVVEVGEWVEDRVLCDGCGHLDLVQDSVSMPAEAMEKLRKVNHPGNRWMFETATVYNDWARVRFKRRHCDVDGLQPMPQGLMHRCHAYQSKIDSDVNSGEKDAAWWD